MEGAWFRWIGAAGLSDVREEGDPDVDLCVGDAGSGPSVVINTMTMTTQGSPLWHVSPNGRAARSGVNWGTELAIS